MSILSRDDGHVEKDKYLYLQILKALYFTDRYSSIVSKALDGLIRTTCDVLVLQSEAMHDKGRRVPTKSASRNKR